MPFDLTNLTSQGRVAANVRFHMGVAGMPKGRVAKVLGISTAEMTSRYNGDSRFRLGELEELAQLLDVPLDHLTSQDGPHGPRRASPQGIAAEAAHEMAAELRGLLREVAETAAVQAEVAARLAAHTVAIEQLIMRLGLAAEETGQ